MLLKLLKLNANDAIISGATATSSSGSVTFRKTCHARCRRRRAPPRYSSAGIDCSAPSETRKKYGNVSQTLTRITETRAHVRVEQPGDAGCGSTLIDDAEVVVEQALPDEQIERRPGPRTG